MLAASLWIPTPEQRLCKYWGQYFDSFSLGRELWNLSLSTGQNWFWLFTTGLKGNQTTIKGRMILEWSFLAIGRLRPPIATSQSFPSSLSSLSYRWIDLLLSMILLLEDSPIPAIGNSFAQSDGFTWVHIRREHLLISMILFRMASKPITWLYN